MKLKNRLLLATAGTVLVVLGFAEWLSYRETSAMLRAHEALMQRESDPTVLLASLRAQREALFTRHVWIHVVHGLVLVLALTTVLSLLWHWLVISRLRILLRHMNWMRRGTWSETILIRGDDEIAQLNDALNRLGRQLTENFEQSTRASKLAALALLGQRLVSDVSLANVHLRAAEGVLRSRHVKPGPDPVLDRLETVIRLMERIPVRFQEDFDRQFGGNGADDRATGVLPEHRTERPEAL